MKVRVFATGSDGVFKAGMTDFDVADNAGLVVMAQAVSYVTHGTVAFMFDDDDLDPRRVISVEIGGEVCAVLTVGDRGDYRVDMYVEGGYRGTIHAADGTSLAFARHLARVELDDYT